jgi:glucose/arabinose dehydrogenase
LKTVGIRRRTWTCLALIAAAAALAPAAVQAQQVGDIQATHVSSFDEPVFVTSAPGEPKLLFVVEQAGKVKVLKNGKKAGTFLNLTSRVGTLYQEQGLLSIAFPPNYAKSKRFYVYYDNKDCVQAVIACNIEVDEFMVKGSDPTRARPGSRRKVIEITHHEAPNHNGGTAMFGPDGKLWLATGDGGAGNDAFDNASRTSKLLGKLLRINPRKNGHKPYSIPKSNPFRGDVPGRGEIWSAGLRNPFRFSFDGNTGDLVIGDVGQDSTEEVDYVSPAGARGNSFGWPAREGDIAGPHPERTGPGDLIEPIAAYTHTGGRCAITGGVVARDPRLQGVFDPDQGRYLYADYCAGPIETLRTNDGNPPLFGNSLSFDTGISNPASFGVDSRKRIYVTSHSGTLYRLDPTQ